MAKNKRLLFVAYDSGGAAVLLPVMRSFLKKKGFSLLAFAGGPAERTLSSAFGKGEVEFVPRGMLCSLAAEKSIDLVVTGTGVSEFERASWGFWRRSGVPTLSINDSWNRMEDRYTTRNGGLALSDYIGVPDAQTKKEMVRLGAQSSRVFVVGQPYVESMASKGLPNAKSRKLLRKRLGIGQGQFVLLFASEAFGKHYSGYGYNEYDVLREILSAHRMLLRHGIPARMAVKLHPEEKRRKYDSSAFPPGTLIFQREISASEALSISDLVCGSTSVILLESCMHGIPTISVQPGMAGIDQCQASRLGLARLSMEKGGLARILDAALIKKKGALTMNGKKAPDFSGSLAKTLSLIHKILR